MLNLGREGGESHDTIHCTGAEKNGVDGRGGFRQAAVTEKIDKSLGKEAYRLKIADGGIEIEGGGFSKRQEEI